MPCLVAFHRLKEYVECTSEAERDGEPNHQEREDLTHDHEQGRHDGTEVDVDELVVVDGEAVGRVVGWLVG